MTTMLNFYSHPLQDLNCQCTNHVGSLLLWRPLYNRVTSDRSDRSDRSMFPNMGFIIRLLLLWMLIVCSRAEGEAVRHIHIISYHIHIRSLPEEPHIAWVGATFSDFRHLSWAYFLCKWAKILICWCLTLLQKTGFGQLHKKWAQDICKPDATSWSDSSYVLNVLFSFCPRTKL